MTTLEKIRAEFISHYPKNYAGKPELGGKFCVYSLNDILRILDKYAEQEPKCPCDLCMYDSMDGDYKHCGYYGECPAMAKGGE